MTVGDYEWQIHSAPGHDPHSLILFEADAGILISADALWQNGFGVVFPEIEGLHAFSEVSATLDLIESLKPKVVIPGHGPVFTDVGNALKAARRRLEYFVAEPKRHALHAAKVLIKFKLLEVQQFSFEALAQWVAQTSYFSVLHQSHFADLTPNQWLESVVQDLIRAGAAEKRAALLLNL
jgi:glyoxylase-like metal-dependent hydrolase (beta-lactamase superfamily II)